MKLFTKDNKGPALLSVALDRDVCVLCLIKTKDVFHYSNIVSDISPLLQGSSFMKY